MNNKEFQWFNIIKNDRDLIEDSQIFNLDRPFENAQLNDLLYYFRKKLNDSNKYKRPQGALKDAYKDLSTHYPENDLKRHIDASTALKKRIKDIEEELIGRYQLRTVQNKCEEYINCMNIDMHPQDVIDDIKSMVDKLEDSVTESESMTKEEARDAILEKYINCSKESVYIKTGIDGIDNIIIGLEESSHYIIGGRPSMGKTALGLSIQANIALSGIKVGIVSVETLTQGLVERLASISSEVSTNVFRGGTTPTQDEYYRFTNSLTEVVDNPNFVVEGTTNRSITNVSRIIRKMKRDHPDMRVIIVDYLQKIESTNKNAPKHNQIEEVSGRITDLCKKLNVAMVSLAQLNRESEKKQKDDKPEKPDLHSFDGSSSIEKDADVCMLIYRDRDANIEAQSPQGWTEKSIFNGDPERQSVSNLQAGIIVAKNRDGRTGLDRMRFNAPCTKFYSNDEFNKNSYSSFST